MPEKSNENVKKMAELLRSGNTMLNRSCPVCNTPIFRNKEGDLFCPSCNREVKIVDDDTKEGEEETSKTPSPKLTQQSRGINDIEEEEGEVINKTLTTLKEKILALLNRIESETQLNQLRDYLQVLKDLYDLLFFIQKEKR
jgi:UPF0148 protein